MMLAIVILFATLNPTRVSYVRWVWDELKSGTVTTTSFITMVVAGVLLGAGLFLCFYRLKDLRRHRWRIIAFGTITTLIIYGLMQWIFDWELWVSLQALAWVGLTIFALIAGIALASPELKNLHRRLGNT
jgi:uncharacterized BrkB/YihY/UPF0761 family membrane protein